MYIINWPKTGHWLIRYTIRYAHVLTFSNTRAGQGFAVSLGIDVWTFLDVNSDPSFTPWLYSDRRKEITITGMIQMKQFIETGEAAIWLIRWFHDQLWHTWFDWSLESVIRDSTISLWMEWSSGLKWSWGQPGGSEYPFADDLIHFGNFNWPDFTITLNFMFFYLQSINVATVGAYIPRYVCAWLLKTEVETP